MDFIKIIMQMCAKLKVVHLEKWSLDRPYSKLEIFLQNDDFISKYVKILEN